MASESSSVLPFEAIQGLTLYSDDEDKSSQQQEPEQQEQNSTIAPSKNKRQRKIQTEEEYNYQLNRWRETGPMINTDTWLNEVNLAELDISDKLDRVKLLHVCELHYYKRDYSTCLKVINVGESLYGVDLNKVGPKIKQLNNKETTEENEEEEEVKWDKNIEKNIAELYHIKMRCLAKLS
ncbi:conserved hypothetical protein [Candida albicans WO-1]|uniref:Uncharacterized protein n=1 Tax=Candida albicans (strain WO-1) TaxID=294748 RepID=C4YI00_CANAW|nr:conserved hypothetical protein [Candida albicans WO-1]